MTDSIMFREIGNYRIDSKVAEFPIDLKKS
jgi:hypothetical protein